MIVDGDTRAEEVLEIDRHHSWRHAWSINLTKKAWDETPEFVALDRDGVEVFRIGTQLVQGNLFATVQLSAADVETIAAGNATRAEIVHGEELRYAAAIRMYQH